MSNVKELDNVIKTLKRRKDDIEKKNTAFKRMTPSQRRVAIAKDALAQVNNKFYNVQCGSYIETPNAIFDYDEKSQVESGNCPLELKTKQLSEAIDSMSECTVCARGALFLSLCRTFNNYSVTDAINAGASPHDMPYYTFNNKEQEFFDSEQIQLIETCFEVYNFSDSIDYENEEAAIEYGRSFTKPKTRLIAILKNIIKNKGTFIIPKEFYAKCPGRYCFRPQYRRQVRADI